MTLYVRQSWSLPGARAVLLTAGWALTVAGWLYQGLVVYLAPAAQAMHTDSARHFVPLWLPYWLLPEAAFTLVWIAGRSVRWRSVGCVSAAGAVQFVTTAGLIPLASVFGFRPVDGIPILH